jgi:NAD(P)-dependent dehydrogenase (short-subunit alcohol dehydrogenase family)
VVATVDTRAVLAPIETGTSGGRFRAEPESTEEAIVRVAGKVMVVTGGGNGIGRQVVLELLRRGAWVAALDIRQESLAETSSLAHAGGRLETYVVDITDRDEVLAVPDKIESALGQIDGVVHVAGIMQPFLKVNDLEFDAIERLVDVNLWGTINVVKSFLPHLLERPVAHLANVSSMGGFLPVPGQTIYGATKAAVKLMTEGLYAELIDTGVGVTVVMPGSIATDIATNSGVDMSGMDVDAAAAEIRTTSPEEAARIIVDGIEDDQLHVYVGRDSLMMGILSRAAPKRATHLIQRQMRALLG